MKVIEVVNPGLSARLEFGLRPIPKAGDDEVLVKIHAAGVNRADIFQKQGNYNPPSGASDILGLEIAGEISSVGKNVIDFKLGDRVCAVVKGGAYAEYALVPAAQLLNNPKELDYTHAAALPEAIYTSWYALVELGNLREGDRVLIHGGSSGIGSIMIQMAKEIGAEVYATSTRQEKLAAIEKLGARPLNSQAEDFSVAIKNMTNGKNVDLIVDMVGGDFFQKNLTSLTIGGRLVQIAFLRGAKINVDLAPLLMKNLSVKSFRLRTLGNKRLARITEKIKENIWPLVISGKIKPIIDSVFEIADVTKAHARMESGKNLGKIILKF